MKEDEYGEKKKSFKKISIYTLVVTLAAGLGYFAYTKYGR
jgi:hypothetical protein